MRSIVINDEGLEANGYTGSEIVAALVEALCHMWDDWCGSIDLYHAGERVIDTLAAESKYYKVRKFMSKATEKSGEENENDD